MKLSLHISDMCGKCLLFHEYKSAINICSENIRFPNQYIALELINQNNTLSLKGQMRHEINGRPLRCLSSRCSACTQKHGGDQLDSRAGSQYARLSTQLTIQDWFSIVGLMVIYIYRLLSFLIFPHSEYQRRNCVRNTEDS